VHAPAPAVPEPAPRAQPPPAEMPYAIPAQPMPRPNSIPQVDRPATVQPRINHPIVQQTLVPPIAPRIAPPVLSHDVQETHTQPSPAMLRKRVPLQLDTEDAMTRHLPKQSEIDRLLKKLNQSRLQNLHLPYEKRELARLQAQCPNFKDIYAFISEGILPSPKLAANYHSFLIFSF